MQIQQKSLSNKKPIILITTSNVNSPRLGDIIGDTDIAYADKATARAIIKAGGVPLYVPTSRLLEADDLEVYIELADGLVLPGADNHVSPKLYGETEVEIDDVRVDEQRDQIDMKLVCLAYERKIPLLGICKGMQIINVALGGTLHQRIVSHSKQPVEHSIPGKRTYVTHKAALIERSLLKEIFHNSELGLNGGHQQAVNRLSEYVRPSAIAKDGIVEAYEGVSHPFLLGVQFHAELLESSMGHCMIFKYFIDAAQSYELNERMAKVGTGS